MMPTPETAEEESLPQLSNPKVFDPEFLAEPTAFIKKYLEQLKAHLEANQSPRLNAVVIQYETLLINTYEVTQPENAPQAIAFTPKAESATACKPFTVHHAGPQHLVQADKSEANIPTLKAMMLSLLAGTTPVEEMTKQDFPCLFLQELPHAEELSKNLLQAARELGCKLSYKGNSNAEKWNEAFDRHNSSLAGNLVLGRDQAPVSMGVARPMTALRLLAETDSESMRPQAQVSTEVSPTSSPSLQKRGLHR